MKMKLLFFISFPSLCLAFVVPTQPWHLLLANRHEGRLPSSDHRSSLPQTDAGNEPPIESSGVADNLISVPLGILTKFFDTLLDAVVTILAVPLALVLAKIINHPSVREALGQCIVSGVKQLCTDPELDDYVDRAGAILGQDLHMDARDAGEAFPNLAKNFMLGLIGAFRDGWSK